MATAAPAMADYGFSNFDVTFTNADGTPATQAGSHPFATTTELWRSTATAPSTVKSRTSSSSR